MLLELYALYKQATAGDVSGERPGMMDFINRAKYDAWERYRGYSSEAAMERYLKWPTHSWVVDISADVPAARAMRHGRTIIITRFVASACHVGDPGHGLSASRSIIMRWDFLLKLGQQAA